MKSELSLGEIILANSFINKWTKKESAPSFTTKIKNVAKPPQDLKQQINVVIQRLDVQTQSLNGAVKRFENRDADVFNRVVKAITDRDQARANILAGELSEIRKVEKMLSHASLALESLSMRLNTVSEVGDLVTVLAPAAKELSSIRSGMSCVLPEAGRELESIGSLLSDIVITTNQSNEGPVNVGGTVSEDAVKILEEAEVAAERSLVEKFPDVGSRAVVSKRTSIEV
jgi:division protein CdvB (Snf7/Vps24/ESCRT-III family)